MYVCYWFEFQMHGGDLLWKISIFQTYWGDLSLEKCIYNDCVDVSKLRKQNAFPILTVFLLFPIARTYVPSQSVRMCCCMPAGVLCLCLRVCVSFERFQWARLGFTDRATLAGDRSGPYPRNSLSYSPRAKTACGTASCVITARHARVD